MRTTTDKLGEALLWFALIVGVAAMILHMFNSVSGNGERPYKLVLVSPLTGITAIEFNSEKSCLAASAQIREAYDKTPVLNCMVK